VLTVLIASLNGEHLLPSVLEAYCRIEAPEGGWKLVIVDNGSTDRTKAIILSYSDRLPITYVLEPQPGKNAALNTGLSHLDGDLVVFTDDDIFPRGNWLSQLRRAADTHASFTIFAGIIHPRWEVRPEDWILNWVPLSVTYGLSSAQLTEGATTPSHTFGGNMAIRREIFREGYRFDPMIGPRGSQYPIGSETQLVRRLVADGSAIWACGGAIVEHFVRRAHLQKPWILGRATRYGRGRYRLSRMEPEEELRTVADVPRYVIRSMLAQAVGILSALLRGDAERLFRARWELNYLHGIAIEARIMAREERRRAGKS
jgi:glycosyltransferase involved in cell wall biosynthesis